MNTPITLKSSFAIGLFTIGALAQANTPLLENADFATYVGDNVGWAVGSNSFVGGVWQAYISDAYTLDDRVDPDGAGFVYKSWDDETSDTLENYLLQEFNAGPVTGAWPSVFNTGDVIVFKGSARATRTGNDTSDMVVRAFIKTLGYNNQGWQFQVKNEYSSFHNIGSTLEPFELSMTFPDLTVDDSLQVVQVGFEITNSWDGAAMDAGTIYFENVEAYIQGDVGPEMWKGFEVLSDPDGWVNTGDSKLGWIFIRNEPYFYSDSLSRWFYMSTGDPAISGGGEWIYVYTD